MAEDSEIVSNRKARHDYEILEVFETGIVLLGTEIKSLRDGGGGLADAYVRLIDNEIFLVGGYIAPYKFGSVFNHEERRDRKLLLHRHEIQRLKKQVQQKGLTIVPLKIYLVKGRAKLQIALAKGKKKGDKRETIKERDVKRQIQTKLKGGGGSD